MIKLYDYYRSSCSYRVRIALNLKGIDYDKIPIHLVQDGGMQNQPSYRALNPQGLVPSLDTGEHIITQSLAIIEYLNDIEPSPPLLPPNPLERAEIRSLALLIACEIHPLNNLRVLNTLKENFHADESAITAWYHQWLKAGFDALEKRLSALPREKPVCFKSDISLADICLIPQVYNAMRFEFSLENYPLIMAINEYCLSLPAFQNASP